MNIRTFIEPILVTLFNKNLMKPHGAFLALDGTAEI